ncbi:MAG: MMPL family transporter, partial [Acidobacteriota bacterium]
MSTPDTKPGSDRAQRFGSWIIRWRWAVIFAALLITVVAGSGAAKLTFRDDYRAFFSSENPQLTAFEAMENIYTKNDNILFVLAPDDGDAFSADTLAAVGELTDGAWKLPFALRVDSLTNFQHTEAFEDDLIVEDLLEGPAATSAAARQKARRVALSEPLLRNRLVPERAHVTGVNVTLNRPGKALDETAQAVSAARALAASVAARHPGLDIHMTGMVMLNNAFQEASQHDAMSLVPAMFGVIVLVAWLLLRSVSGTIATLVVIVMSLVIAMGLAGWMGIALTPPSASAPTMIMTLAVADSIHILVAMLAKMRGGSSKNAAIVESLRINMQPVFLTSLTTAIGFLSLNSSDAPPFGDLGNITSMGVTAAFVLSVTFMPALISVLPVRRRAGEEASGGRMARVSEFVIRNRRTLLWASAVVVMVFGLLVPANELSDEFVNYFDDSVAFRTDTDFVMDNLTGIYQIEHSLGAGESGGVANPEYLAKLDELAEWYERQPGVVHVASLSTTMKRLNKNLHGDDPAWYRTPEERQLAAQYLLLYEMSLPYGLDLNNQINIDKSSTRFTVTTSNLSSVELIDLASRGEQWLRDNAPESMYATAVSPGLMFAHVSRRNISSMLLGTILAFGLISTTLAVSMRSLRVGLLSLIPNLVPAVVGFGIWALWDGTVNLGLSVVSAMTLGIVVDDTVHFISKY